MTSWPLFFIVSPIVPIWLHCSRSSNRRALGTCRYPHNKVWKKSVRSDDKSGCEQASSLDRFSEKQFIWSYRATTASVADQSCGGKTACKLGWMFAEDSLRNDFTLNLLFSHLDTFGWPWGFCSQSVCRPDCLCFLSWPEFFPCSVAAFPELNNPSKTTQCIPGEPAWVTVACLLTRENGQWFEFPVSQIRRDNSDWKKKKINKNSALIHIFSDGIAAINASLTRWLTDRQQAC